MEKATLRKGWRVATSKQKPEGIQPVKEGHREPPRVYLVFPQGGLFSSQQHSPFGLRGQRTGLEVSRVAGNWRRRSWERVSPKPCDNLQLAGRSLAGS